ncbi:hypothetical protein F4859DRAFT_512301 [Xylaria cf. heliscus]|nr:hypothetical protein F4859DRAFT_512301 [Xylaria cf. heliscus]
MPRPWTGGPGARQRASGISCHGRGTIISPTHPQGSTEPYIHTYGVQLSTNLNPRCTESTESTESALHFRKAPSTTLTPCQVLLSTRPLPKPTPLCSEIYRASSQQPTTPLQPATCNPQSAILVHHSCPTKPTPNPTDNPPGFVGIQHPTSNIQHPNIQHSAFGIQTNTAAATTTDHGLLYHSPSKQAESCTKRRHPRAALLLASRLHAQHQSKSRQLLQSRRAPSEQSLRYEPSESRLLLALTHNPPRSPHAITTSQLQPATASYS